MSAEQIAAANGEVISAGAAEQIDSAIQYLLQAQRRLQETQAKIIGTGHHPGATITVDPRELWHALETIDDRIHDALSKLGE